MDEWIDSYNALKLVASIDRFAAHTICGRACDGLLTARARRYVRGSTILDNYLVPTNFRWARGDRSLAQNWAAGDFETPMGMDRTVCRAYGVQFRRTDIEAILPRDATPRVTEGANGASAVPTGAGRKPSNLWPDWVAELVRLVHEQGLPSGAGAQGQEELIRTVADRLASRGRLAPGRTTVQPVVHAVLTRLREEDNA